MLRLEEWRRVEEGRMEVEQGSKDAVEGRNDVVGPQGPLYSNSVFKKISLNKVFKIGINQSILDLGRK
jgi:hypothetical protein